MDGLLLDLHREIELFLYREAKVLDAGDFDAWLELFTEDARYWMPITETREVGDERSPTAGEWALMEEDKRFLMQRRARLAGGLAHSEQPRSRTRRFISNVLVSGEPDGPLEVESNVLVFQSRRGNSEQFYVGRRVDTLVHDGAGDWKISARLVVLDHRVLPRALSIFF